jgi:hypothetical protein
MAESLPTYALTTVARVKDRLAITTAGHDALLLRLVLSATDFIEGQCNRRFKATDYTELHSFEKSNNRRIFAKHPPINTLTKIESRTGTVNSPNYVDIPATDYIKDEDGKSGIITVEGGWLYKGPNTVRVTYNGGYLIDFANFGSATHTLPADISELCERLVVSAFKRREAEGKDTESSGGGTITWSKELRAEDKMTLARHTITRFY